MFGQIGPARIDLLNQKDFLRAPPALDLLFPRNGHSYILMALVINQPIALVLAGEAFDFTCFMLHDTNEQITGDAGVQRSGEAGHDVDPISMFSYRHAGAES